MTMTTFIVKSLILLHLVVIIIMTQGAITVMRADNAYDPDVSASELNIDKEVIGGKPCLVFTDNGAGMDFDHLEKMLRYEHVWARMQ